MEDKTVDYKEMYLKLFRATETAIRVLVEAQQECEEVENGEESSGKTKIVPVTP